MNTYLATFHTHLSALRTARALKECAVEQTSGPVPRKLSSSCGVCVRYLAQTALLELMDEDCEAVYLENDGAYTRLYENL